MSILSLVFPFVFLNVWLWICSIRLDKEQPTHFEISFIVHFSGVNVRSICVLSPGLHHAPFSTSSCNPDEHGYTSDEYLLANSMPPLERIGFHALHSRSRGAFCCTESIIKNVEALYLYPWVASHRAKCIISQLIEAYLSCSLHSWTIYPFQHFFSRDVYIMLYLIIAHGEVYDFITYRGIFVL
ncbi:hypothetical protein KP509_25G034900 [Ceratopteris richardii]|uniref:Uncharacterized protein n=1 Tax=Ceratopteris richardii TaxID=49495 RepID=A0A8T2RRL0_CERRI|nr:hypothetical protein KP509_25G034900 [Ceratopteris richardii]